MSETVFPARKPTADWCPTCMGQTWILSPVNDEARRFVAGAVFHRMLCPSCYRRAVNNMETAYNAPEDT